MNKNAKYLCMIASKYLTPPSKGGTIYVIEPKNVCNAAYDQSTLAYQVPPVEQ